MDVKLFVLLLGLFSVGNCLLKDSFESCPNENSLTIAGDVRIIEGARFLRVIERIVRIPASGKLDAPIKCVMINDDSGYNSGGTPVIIEGGVEFYHVTVKLTSKLSRELNYQVIVYT